MKVRNVSLPYRARLTWVAGLIMGIYNPFRLPVKGILPDKKAFLSVPLGHSRKPNIRELLLPYLDTPHPYVLELFARYVPAGNDGRSKKGFWFSVGNEAIKYNQVDIHITREDRQPS